MIGWTNLGAAAIITTHSALLHGVVLLADSTGGRVTVYAGQDDAGRKIGTFKGQADVSKPIPFSPPLDCEAGIYVGDFSHIDEVTILWSPKP